VQDQFISGLFAITNNVTYNLL